MPDHHPTAADLKRDLEADLDLVCDPVLQASAVENRTYFERHNCWPDTPWMAFPLTAFAGWPAAIRRALWAEAEVERLRQALDDIWWAVAAGQDNAACDEPHATIRRMVEETLTPKEGT